MCGISVVVDRAGSPTLISALENMHDEIAHRGPDGEGVFLVSSDGHGEHFEAWDGVPRDRGRDVLGMAFRRLAIMDLSAAADQPMATPDGRLVLVFNGEIYNFRELREKLVSHGHDFRTTGDTEVVLRSYEEWGTDCFANFEGMWAIVVADLGRRRLVVSRDRFGIKPLYWAEEEGRFFLSSEIRQILAARSRKPRANMREVGKYLVNRRYPVTDETFFEGIRSVEPATWFELSLVENGGERSSGHAYWRLSDTIAPEPGPFDRVAYGRGVDAFEEALAASVESHSFADVTVGSLLSGGLDSSTVGSMLDENLSARGLSCPTFSLGYRDEAPEVCELRYVDALVENNRLLNYQTTMTAAWVADNVDRVIRTIEEPVALPALAQRRIFQFGRDMGATVIMDGQGADEILGGYPYHQRLLLRDRLSRGAFGSFGSEAISIARNYENRTLGALGDFYFRPARAKVSGGPKWVSPDLLRKGSDSEALDKRDDPSLVNQRMYFDVRWGNVKLILMFADKNAMAHSVEARVPFFDRRLVELAFSMPDHWKVGGGERKRVLRDVGRRRLPSAITERKDRIGFGMPAGRMMRDDLWSSISESLLDRTFLELPIVDGEEVERLLASFRDGSDRHHRAVWILFALSRWLRTFEVSL